MEKAALLAGFGRDNLRSIALTNGMRAKRSRRDQADLQHGHKSCAIVATTGTTTTTALDPVAAIADLARRHGLWLHVDAAMAGSAMILPECRWMWQGIEDADSLVLNPHKWLGVSFDCSLYYVRNSEHLIRVMSTLPSYLQSAVDDRVKNLRDWGIPLGRRFRAQIVVSHSRRALRGLRTACAANLANARGSKHASADRLAASRFRSNALPAPRTQNFGRRSLGREHAATLGQRVNRSGGVMLTPAGLGRWMVRISIGAVERPRRRSLWELMRREAEGHNADLCPVWTCSADAERALVATFISFVDVRRPW